MRMRMYGGWLQYVFDGVVTTQKGGLLQYLFDGVVTTRMKCCL